MKIIKKFASFHVSIFADSKQRERKTFLSKSFGAKLQKPKENNKMIKNIFISVLTKFFKIDLKCHERWNKEISYQMVNLHDLSLKNYFYFPTE